MNIDFDSYVTPKVAAKAYGVCHETLRRWAKTGKIGFFRTPGGFHRYDISGARPSSRPVAAPPAVKIAKPAPAPVEIKPAAVAAPMPPPMMDPATLARRIEMLAGVA